MEPEVKKTGTVVQLPYMDMPSSMTLTVVHVQLCFCFLSIHK